MFIGLKNTEFIYYKAIVNFIHYIQKCAYITYTMSIYVCLPTSVRTYIILLDFFKCKSKNNQDIKLKF